MRTVTKTYNVYKYNELSEEAKEKVKQWYLDDDFRPQVFENSCMDALNTLFPNSDLKVQFSLSSCQGDGFNIYGKLDLSDVFYACNVAHNVAHNTLDEFENYMTEHEQKTIKAYMETCGQHVTLPYNNYYYYCMADRLDFAEDWIEELKYDRYKNIQVDTIRKMEKLVIEIFSTLSKNYEKAGYKFFYEVDDEELEDACENNNWEFLEDGTFYG